MSDLEVPASDPRADAPDIVKNFINGVESVVPLGNRVRVTVGPVTAEITATSAERLGVAPGVSLVASFKAAGVRLLPV